MAHSSATDAAIQPARRTRITSAAAPDASNCNKSRLDPPAGYSCLLQSSVRGETMNLTGAVRQLRKERHRAQAEVQRLDAALAVLGSLNSSFKAVRPKKRKVS